MPLTPAVPGMPAPKAPPPAACKPIPTAAARPIWAPSHQRGRPRPTHTHRLRKLQHQADQSHAPVPVAPPGPRRTPWPPAAIRSSMCSTTCSAVARADAPPAATADISSVLLNRAGRLGVAQALARRLPQPQPQRLLALVVRVVQPATAIVCDNTHRVSGAPLPLGYRVPRRRGRRTGEDQHGLRVRQSRSTRDRAASPDSDRDLAPGRRHRNRIRSRTTGNEQWAAAGTSQPRVAGWLSAEWT